MKDLTTVLCLVVAATGAGCVPPAPVASVPTDGPGRVQAAAATPSQADLFASGVRPVLASRCTPCHEPGGRMYPTMPFDSREVVASHRAGILRRLKDPAERRALEDWLATLPPG